MEPDLNRNRNLVAKSVKKNLAALAGSSHHLSSFHSTSEVGVLKCDRRDSTPDRDEKANIAGSEPGAFISAVTQSLYRVSEFPTPLDIFAWLPHRTQPGE